MAPGKRGPGKRQSENGGDAEKGVEQDEMGVESSHSASAAIAEGTGAMQAGATYTLSGLTDGNHVCWQTHASAAPTTLVATDCLVASNVAAIGVSSSVVCSAALSGATTLALTYDAPATTKVAFMECTGAGTGTGVGLDVTLVQPSTVGWFMGQLGADCTATCGAVSSTMVCDASLGPVV